MLAHVLLLAIAAATPSPVPAATPTTDPCAGLLNQLNRPTIGYSPCAAKRGTAVLEMGYQHQWNADSTTRDQFGQGFLRFGVAPQLELDVIGPNGIAQRGPSSDAFGFADSGIGFKYELLAAAQWQLGVDGLYTTPNGARALTAGNSTLTTNFDAVYQLTKTTSFASTLSFAAAGGFGVSGEHARYGTFMPSCLVLQQFDSSTQAYVEYVNVSRTAPDLGVSSFLDAGLQQLVGTKVELDVEYGHSLSGATAQRFNYIGAGLGILVP
jgi:hypothetical protein